MKTVGKQLQEARQSRNWTPEMAARETKIKVDRLRDLESDDYSHFNNATYARGFVRTYARALGLDEYKILRQLDSKLPDDDTANIASDGGVAYLPETALPPRAAHRDFTGLYVVMGLGGVVILVIAFVLFEAYRVGELSQWIGADTASNGPATSTNATASAASPGGQAPDRALPVDPNAAPPPTAVPAVAAAAPADTNAPSAVPVAQPADGAAPRALPVNPVAAAAPAAASSSDSAETGQPGGSSGDFSNAPRALPVNIADNNTPPPAEKVAPRALPVDPNTPPPPVSDTPSSNAPAATPPAADPSAAPAASNPPGGQGQPLVLTASRDSFVRVTTLDTAGGDKPVYAAVLHSGQSVGFSGHKFSVDVGIPSAVDIKLDGVNYGPHSDGSEPETFTVVSHVQ
ncbi:MAG: helix-turn-helix domain-containing protein [Verrucomicrobiota bacterium]